MKSNLATALVPYLKRIKLVSVALALVFLANLGWGQLPASGSAKPHCSMTASQHTDASTLHDCCPKRGKAPPNRPDCCKHPCYTQGVSHMPMLLADSNISITLFQTQLPRQRYRDRLVASLSPPELRPPII